MLQPVKKNATIEQRTAVKIKEKGKVFIILRGDRISSQLLSSGEIVSDGEA
jgi:hypothetical protein